MTQDDSWFVQAPLVIWETKRQQQCLSVGSILSEKNRFPINTSNQAPSQLAFDLGRAVTVKSCVSETGAMTAAEFSDWKEFAKSYLYGRAVWVGALVESFVSNHQIAQELLKGEHSPWEIYGFPKNK